MNNWDVRGESEKMKGVSGLWRKRFLKMECFEPRTKKRRSDGWWHWQCWWWRWADM